MKARVLVLDVIGDKGLYETEIETLQDIYEALGCNCFDIARRKVGYEYFDIFCDDEGLFKPNLMPSALDSEFKVALVGNLIFANHDSAGETTSLTDEDIKMIRKCLTAVVDFDTDPIQQWNMIFPVDY